MTASSKFKCPDIRGSELSSEEASDTGAERVGATVMLEQSLWGYSDAGAEPVGLQ